MQRPWPNEVEPCKLCTEPAMLAGGEKFALPCSRHCFLQFRALHLRPPGTGVLNCCVLFGRAYLPLNHLLVCLFGKLMLLNSIP